MPAQTYASHRHRPWLTDIGFLFWLIAMAGFFFSARPAGRIAVALGFAGAILVLLWISRAYTIRLQDRIIRLEMRLRCASLLNQQQLAIVSRLSKPQMMALRFASDAELGALAERAEREQLTADQIKRAITSWVPDLDRT
jgi:hypothetical protein